MFCITQSVILVCSVVHEVAHIHVRLFCLFFAVLSVLVQSTFLKVNFTWVSRFSL